MTILSKKKPLQSKPEESSDTQNLQGGSHNLGLPVNTLTNQERSQERLGSPQCWPREEKRSTHVSPVHFDEFDYEFDSLESGPSQSKRRHRSSPHRVVRNGKLRERDRAAQLAVGSSPKSAHGGSLSPQAGPSYASDEKVDTQGAGNGYNSGDEYDSRPVSSLSASEWFEQDRLFEKRLRKCGYILKQMEDDGACLFRAVADQIYGDQEMHGIVRKHCMDYIEANSDYFSQYVTEDINTYVTRKRLKYTHGNHIEMQAMSEIYNRNIEVFCYGRDPINIFQGTKCDDNEPIRLSYQRGVHYNSIVNPHKPTVGVGLGLPSHHPGAADKNLMKDAVRQSEDFHIEHAMLEDKLRATDWEATNEAIEEQVARESYLQWLRDSDKRASHKATATATSTVAVASTTSQTEKGQGQEGSSQSQPVSCSSVAANDDNHNDASTSQASDTVSFLSALSPQLLGLSNWEDVDALAQALALSQQEYLDKLKKTHSASQQQMLTGAEDANDLDVSDGPSTSS